MGLWGILRGWGEGGWGSRFVDCQLVQFDSFLSFFAHLALVNMGLFGCVEGGAWK